MSKQLGKISQALWTKTPRNVFRTDLTTERFEELELLRANAVEFKEICRINYGAQISSKEKGGFKRAKYLGKNDGSMGEPKKFYEGSNMRPFGMTWGRAYVDMAKRGEMYGPRTSGFFENDKLSVRHISGDYDSFVAWVDEEHYYTDHGVIHAVPWCLLNDEQKVNGKKAYTIDAVQLATSQRYPLFFLLGILMSRPAMELYAELYATGSLQGAFSHVYPDMVKGLPIPKLAKEPGAAPDDWLIELRGQATAGRHSRTSVRRAFGRRDQLAGVLAAAARERQELEVGRGQRRNDFVEFMQVHSTGWRWKRGESLENPPDETELLSRLGKDLTSLNTMKAIRTEINGATRAAADDAAKAGELQGIMNALAAALYSSSA